MKLKTGDITKISADAIVNAANTKLQYGGGVAAAIVRAGGQIVQEESNKIDWCGIGKAVAITAGNLPAKCVIHVPTIDYISGKRADLNDVKNGVLAALEIAKNTGCKTVSFPLLGTGVVGLPTAEVAKAIKESEDSVLGINSTLVAHSEQDYNLLKKFFKLQKSRHINIINVTHPKGGLEESNQRSTRTRKEHSDASVNSGADRRGEETRTVSS